MKQFNKVLSVFLAALFCFAALAVCAAAEEPAAEAPEVFQFGYYPQTRVTDTAILDALKTAKLNADGSATLDDVTYVPLTVEGNSVPGGGPFATMYGYYPENIYWFRMEPIEWIVLEVEETADSKLLIAKNVLDVHTFNDTVRDSAWANSDVRAWLNDVFYNMAFTAKEQRYILESNLKNEGNPVSGKAGSADTTDKIFLPSFAEITNWKYGFNQECNPDSVTSYDDFGRYVGYYEQDPQRQAIGTDYAKGQGVWANFGSNGRPVATCRYWLRTVGWDTTYAAAVLEDGRVSTGWEVNYNIVGIRPMLRVAANAVIDNRDGSSDEPKEQPFKVIGPEGEVQYKQKVKFEAEVEVEWKSSDPRIAEINPVTGEVTMHRAGTVTITATSKATGDVVQVDMKITYSWWQQIIRIVLFGWIWY